MELKFGSDSGPRPTAPAWTLHGLLLCSKYCGNPEYSLRSPYLLYSK